MKKIIVLLILLLTPFNSLANQEMIEYQIKSELFMKRLILGNINQAYDLLLIGSPLITNKKNLTILKNTNTSIIKTYGKPLNFDFIGQKIIDKNKVSVQYILKSEKYPLIWEFNYYKPQNEWLITKIIFLKA